MQPDRHDSRDWRGLAGLILGLLVAGGVLYATAGLPRPPAGPLDANVIGATLRGSSVPLDALGYLLSLLAWALWAWLALSILLRVGVDLAEGATRGAAWLSAPRRVSERITLPAVRHAVDGALAVAIVVQVVGHSAAPAAAAPAAEAAPVVQPAAPSADAPAPGASTDGSARVTRYTVQRGDSLWSIATRFYGTGYEYPRLVESNVGRAMRDGQVFSPSGVIRPGWVLTVPLPSHTLEAVDGQPHYTVERGDTLWGISARFLGDPTRWREIYTVNRDSARLPDGHVLEQPDLIWPGLVLQVPGAADDGSQPDGSVASDQPSGTEPDSPEGAAPAGSVVLPGSDAAAGSAALPGADAAGRVAMPGADAANARPSAADASSLQTSEATASPAWQTFLPEAAAATSTGVVASAFAAGLLLRRRSRRGLDEPPQIDEPESDVVVRGGFAQFDDLSRSVLHRLNGGGRDPAGRAQAVANDVLRVLDSHGLRGQVGLLAVREGRSGLSLQLVTQRQIDRPRVLELASTIGAQLGLQASAQLSRDHDVTLWLGGQYLMPASQSETDSACHLLPVAVLPDSRILHLNWDALGQILIGGHAEAPVLSVLTSLLALLVASRGPDALRVWTIARAGALPSGLERLPHLLGGPIEPTDDIAVSAALHEARRELVRRMQRSERGQPIGGLPEVVLVAAETGALVKHAATLDLLSAYGPSHRVRLILAAPSDSGQPLPERSLPHFATRLVLRCVDEADSRRLLGTDEAVHLLGGGQLLVRLDERQPLEAYARRVTADELERLVRVLSGASAALTPDPLPLEAGARLERPDRFPAGSAPAAEIELRPLASLVEVQCLGGFAAVSRGRNLRADAASDVDQSAAWELLAFLAAQPEGISALAEVLGAVWPEREPTAATARLTEVVQQLNGLLPSATTGDPGLVQLDTRRETCCLRPDLVQSDAQRALRLCRVAPLMPADKAIDTWQRVRELYRGNLLEGPGAREYTWLTRAGADGELSPRQRFRELHLRATFRLARLLARSGRPSEAVPLLNELLSGEPTLEDAVRELYRCYAALGDMAGLIDTQQRLRAVLAEDSASPEAATVTLFAELQAQLQSRPAVPA